MPLEYPFANVTSYRSNKAQPVFMAERVTSKIKEAIKIEKVNQEADMEKMEKTKREDYIDELSDKLKEWNKDLDNLKDEIDEEFDELEQQYRDKVNELNQLRTRMQDKLNKLKDSGEKALEPLKKDFTDLLKDSKKGIRSIREELFER